MPSPAVSISQLIARLVNRLHIGMSELHHQRQKRALDPEWLGDCGTPNEGRIVLPVRQSAL
jgi:hypothetical protein